MVGERKKRKLSAILSADVKDYSRLMSDNEEATVSTIAEYREVMIVLIQENDGRVVDAIGDNLLAEFQSVVDAIRCAVEVQKEFAKRNTELPERRRMEFRIGINLGDVIEDGEIIYGDGVNIAARLEGLADAGGICISGTAYDHVGKNLPYGFEYLGEKTVKNIEQPVRTYRILTEPESAGKLIGNIKSSKKWMKAVIPVLAVLVLVAGWGYFAIKPLQRLQGASRKGQAIPPPDKPFIAVLPFKNLSQDAEQDFFSDGITEEIITSLSKTPKLSVISRNSTFVYKGKPMKVQQIAKELGVRYVLEGSVRKDEEEERVRITAQLIDALKGHHLWAERYDRTVMDIFAVQDEIAKNIITALHVELTEGEQARIYAKGTDNLGAYMKIMEAKWLCAQATKDGVHKARQLSEEAIALDSEYALSYSILGLTHILDIWLGMSKSPKQSVKRAIELRKRAIRLDSSLGQAHSGLGYVYAAMTRQYDKGIAEGEKALALEPNSADVVCGHAIILTYAGRWKEAIPLFLEALRLNPKPPNNYYRHFAVALREMGQYDKAVSQLKRAIEQEPNDILAYLILTTVYSYSGDEKKARTAAKEVLRINPNFRIELLPRRTHKDITVIAREDDALRQAGLK